MKQSSVTRRLLAGAAGLTVGMAGVFALAGPAQATDDEENVTTTRVPFKSLEVTGVPECDTETGNWTVLWTVTNTSLIDIDAEITEVEVIGDAEGPIDGDLVIGTVLPKGEAASGTQVFSEENETAQLTVELTWRWGPHWNPTKHSKSKLADFTVELGACKDDVPPPPPEPTEPDLDDALVFGCDLFVLALRNNSEEEGAILRLTPNQETVHGHAAVFVDQIDTIIAGGDAEVPDDFELDVVGTLAAGETFEIGPLAAGEAHAHGFEPSAGLTITAVVIVGTETVAEVELSWDDLLADEGIDCGDEGEGGELPKTGASTGLIALGAVALLALGGGLFLVARRRRVTFTA